MPVLGFGTWLLKGDDARRAVETALQEGYRHIDTADRYENHHEVGEAMQASGVAREEIFLTTKVWHDRLHRDDILADTTRFLEELRMDYLDLLLIHWPNKAIPLEESLHALGDLQQQGIVRGIGVSNFSIKHIEDVMKSGIVIDNNQIEIHPTFPQHELVEYCLQHDITVTAYSPLGRSADLQHPVIMEIAEKHAAPSAAVILAWLRQRGIIAIPKAEKLEHIRGNLASLKLTLTDDDIAAIDALQPQDHRLVDPEWSEF